MFVAVYVGSMFTPGLLDDVDSSHAEAAREMVASGDYVTLHINGVRYLEKAPLPYWLVAASYRVFGVNEFSTRLPMVLSIMLLGLLAFGWGRRAFGQRTAGCETRHEPSAVAVASPCGIDDLDRMRWRMDQGAALGVADEGSALAELRDHMAFQA